MQDWDEDEVFEIRAGDHTGAGALTKVWDFDMRDREAEFKDDLREASGVGRRRGGKPGRRKGVVLSQQVRALVGKGNQAYVDNNIPETLRIMQEVIRIEPRAASAWSVLAQCYEDLGEGEKALQLRIMAAHLHQDPEEWERLAHQSRQQGHHQQTLYCFRKLCQLDPDNVGALWDRASLAKEVGDLRTARHAFMSILRRIPNDLSVLAELRPILIELSDLDQCASLFQEAFDHYQATFPSGQVPQVEPSAGGNPVGFDMMEILVLSDLYNTTGKYERAVETVRRGCRWLQGRASQKFWDAIEDDREWDLPTGPNGESSRIVADGEIQPGMYNLDVNARHRLAIARIRLGDVAEGKMHASIVLSQDALEYGALFPEIADAYFDREMYAEAGHIYEMLGADASASDYFLTSSLQVLLRAAACRRMVGDLREAADVYEHVLKADPSLDDAKKELAAIYEILGETRKALDLVMQVIETRRRAKVAGKQGQEGGDSQPAVDRGVGTSLFEERGRSGKEKATKASGSKAGKLSTAQLRELEAKKEKDAARSFHRVKELWARMLAGDEEAMREWMHEAEALVESFRETRALFLSARHAGFRGMYPRIIRKAQTTNTEANEENMASRLQLELGRDTMAKKAGVLELFRTISFSDWLRMFMQYAFNLTKRDRYDEASEILRHITYSNAFQVRSYQDTIRFALISCSIAAKRYDIAVEQSRKLVNTHQFNNEPLRILIASLGNGLAATDAFLASTLSKHMLRDLRANDTALKNPDTLRWNPVTKRYGTGTKAEEEDDQDVPESVPVSEKFVGGTSLGVHQPKLPTKENPIGVAIYGQICLAAKSYQSALFYLLHAYDYCPYDPLICLCLAIASIGRAMQRQADNRHHLVTQGLAFLTRYRDFRGEDAPDEVEYNFGRAFHQLGLLTLAVKHYERVLAQVEKRVAADSEADTGVAPETAYNLSLIYMTTGATPLAEQLYRRWLTI
ncbi:TPR-like protein [Cytidiella melzeri]|nr:TPR-like protein [Cytidiella melzeri]